MKPEGDDLAALLSRLSVRERQVLDFALAGKSNRETGTALGISPRTVEVFKARMLIKMRAYTLAELRVRLGKA